MTTKQFYLFTLIVFSFLIGMLLMGLWRMLENKQLRKENRGVLFLSLAAFSWSVVGLYKYYDPEIPPLAHAISDRVMSSFSNLFLLASLTYFPSAFEKLKTRFSFFRNSDQWVLTVFIFFTISTALFTAIERSFDNDSGRLMIILVDTIVSLFTIAFTSWALYKSISLFWTSKLLRLVVGVLLFIFILSQIFLPMASVFSELLKPYYYLGLMALLMGVILFGIISVVYFTISNYELLVNTNLTNSTNSPNQLNTLSKTNFEIVGMKIGYLEKEKLYFITLLLKDQIGNVEESTIQIKKLLKPFTHWLVFAASRKTNIQLHHEDISNIKYRMIELWNRFSDKEITQFHIFNNDGGRFELYDMPNGVDILNIDFLVSRFVVRETFGEFQSCFTESARAQLGKLNIVFNKLLGF